MRALFLLHTRTNEMMGNMIRDPVTHVFILENSEMSVKSKMETPMREVQRSRYLNQLIRHKHNGLIKIISCIRRCLKHIF
jgi:hypothetical protein